MENNIDWARIYALRQPLTAVGSTGQLVNVLADDFSYNADATVWKIKLKSGVLWHDGKPFTAADVVYTLQWNLASKKAALGQSVVALWHPLRSARSTRATVELVLAKPNSLVDQFLTSRLLTIFPQAVIQHRTTLPARSVQVCKLHARRAVHLLALGRLLRLRGVRIWISWSSSR